MGKAQRDKGARFEREVCSIIEDVTGYKVKRNLSQTRDGGYDIKFGPFRLECKSRKALSVYDFYDQCEAACGVHDIPVVVMKADRREPLVMMSFRQALPFLADQIDGEI